MRSLFSKKFNDLQLSKSETYRITLQVFDMYARVCDAFLLVFANSDFVSKNIFRSLTKQSIKEDL